MPCTDSTSSDSSPYQPEASHASVFCHPLVPPRRTSLYWPGLNGLSPVASAYRLASVAMVGEANASTTATRTPLPVIPDLATPYAPRICAGV